MHARGRDSKSEAARPSAPVATRPPDRVGPTSDSARLQVSIGNQAVLRLIEASAVQNGVAAPRIVHEVLASPGQPLDAATRGFFEPRFGHDLARVRVHADRRAAESARAVGARAYTVGDQIVLADRQAGNAILTHELAHVVQQSGATGPAPVSDSADGALEHDADTSSVSATKPRLRSGLRLQRWGEDRDVAAPLRATATQQTGLEAGRTTTGTAELSAAQHGGATDRAVNSTLAPGSVQGLSNEALEHQTEVVWQLYRSAAEGSPDRAAQCDNLSVLEQEFARRGRASATLARHALLDAIDGVLASTGAINAGLTAINATQWSHNLGLQPILHRYIGHGVDQLQWILDALGASIDLANSAAEMANPDMARELVRLAGTRLQAAAFGTHLLSAWTDFLRLGDIVTRECIFYSMEHLWFRDLLDVWLTIQPALAHLQSMKLDQVEAVAIATPDLMVQLIDEFARIREAVRVATVRGGQMMQAAQIVEMLTSVASMRIAMPRVPPSGPMTLTFFNIGAVMGGGVAGATRIVVSAEWLAMIRDLVRAGAISIPVASAAARIGAGQAMMSQSNRDMPPGVQEAIESGDLHVTGRRGAGAAQRPQHHVMPQEERRWFEQRGFRGPTSIDEFVVEMEEAAHQAIHGGGNWRLGRTWTGEWNTMIMRTLREAEALAGGRLTRNQILQIIAREMRRYDIPLDFVTWRGR